MASVRTKAYKDAMKAIADVRSAIDVLVVDTVRLKAALEKKGEEEK